MYKDMHGADFFGRPEYRCSQNVIAASEKFAPRVFTDRIFVPSPVDVGSNGLFKWELPKNSLRFFFAKIKT